MTRHLHLNVTFKLFVVSHSVILKRAQICFIFNVQNKQKLKPSEKLSNSGPSDELF
jgi:hypothetical protein